MEDGLFITYILSFMFRYYFGMLFHLYLVVILGGLLIPRLQGGTSAIAPSASDANDENNLYCLSVKIQFLQSS